MYRCKCCKQYSLTLSVYINHLRKCTKLNHGDSYRCGKVSCVRHYSTLNSLYVHMNTIHEHSTMNNHTSTETDIKCASDTSCVESQNSQVEKPESQLLNETAFFIGSLYGSKNVPRSVVQLVVDGLERYLGSLSSVLQVSTPEIQTPHDKHDSSISQNLGISSSIKKSLSPFKTEYKRLEYFRKLGTYIAPVEVVVGQRMDQQRTAIGMSYVPVQCKMQVIPLSQLLKKFVSIPGVLSNILRNMDEMYSSSGSGVVGNIIQAEAWKRAIVTHKNNVVVPLLLFFDDFELGNPLGSKSGVHKLGAVYISIPVLGAEYNSLLDCIFLAALFHSSDRSQFGNSIIFKAVIEELNLLSTQGVLVDTAVYRGVIKFQVAAITGDNLGLNSVLGFVESFTANYPCRICSANKGQIRSMIYEEKNCLRDNVSYETFLNTLDDDKGGVKEKCCWLSLNGFSLFDNVAVDLLHDMLEGVCRYTMTFIISHLVRTDKLIHLNVLKDRMMGFDWGPDFKSKPPSNLEFIGSKLKIRLSGSEMLTFVRYFGILLGDYVPERYNIWDLYILLRSILEKMLSHYVTKTSCEQLRHEIAEFNELFISVTKQHLRPKFHFLVHYPRMLHKFGPLTHIWSMRFEAFHKILKMAGHTSASRVNTTKSIAMRNQLYLNHLLLENKLKDALSFGKETFVTEDKATVLNRQFNLPGCEGVRSSVTWVKLKGVYYNTNSIVTISISEEHEVPVFGRITEIHLTLSNNVIFTCLRYNTLYFDRHYYAHRVERTTDVVYVNCSKLANPMPNTETVMRNLNIYVTVRWS